MHFCAVKQLLFRPPKGWKHSRFLQIFWFDALWPTQIIATEATKTFSTNKGAETQKRHPKFNFAQGDKNKILSISYSLACFCKRWKI